MEKDFYKIEKNMEMPWWHIFGFRYRLYRNGHILWVFSTMWGAKKGIKRYKKKRLKELQENRHPSKFVKVYEE